ncbi:reprolysin-like metallopeptidase [Winogradskyella marincola]|uniref:M12 family metallo-peptidase n=1 Tax=Winogradskyella marincola TaxID=3037795 RepID=A0ABT6G010_9FLAO|nr:zinc-dependent metalloprotease family protein [Winogradskyella sp. YYF002]MDG4715277.1 M12 family metallo-peptidase [Winogradskyella sp. YYF002]
MMKNNYPKFFLILITALFFVSLGNAQKNRNIWSINNDQIKKEDVIFYKSKPKYSTLINISVEALKQQLANVPQRQFSSSKEGVVLQFPNHEGKPESYLVQEASVMEYELQMRFPEIRSFVGKGIDNPAAIMRFSLSPEKGFSGMVLSDGKTVFIEPYTQDLKTYVAFINSDEDGPRGSFVCETEYDPADFKISDEDFITPKNADDGTLRTYRLALACTGEYAQFHGGTVSGALAAMNTTMTRVNGVYERDLGLTMVIIANNTEIIFLNAGTDPYTNNSGGTMLGENQAECDSTIGSANYDIGHVFSTGGGGIAQLRSPCTVNKARGVTGSPVPQGDAFDIDYVAHEMGHQYGGNHTQNNECQRSSVSVEPGSASTIMGYAGICAPNVQNNSDDYFHGENIKEMWANISSGPSSTCFAGSVTNNVAPVANAGADYTIPLSTAFVLRGSATDANTASGLTYCWEQTDATPATMPPQSTSSSGPLFRSLDPSSSPDRYMPTLSTVFSGSLATTWEVVPSVGRTMNFSLTVRDNEAGGGASDSDDVTVTVQNFSTPFTVNTPPTWGANSSQQVSWVVGQTNSAPINCQTVNILFTTNGGFSFTTLASGVPNTGTATITVPGVGNTSNARVLVEAADNIFYAVSDAFSISNAQDFSINSTNGDVSVCGQDSASIDFSYVTSNGFSETTSFNVSGLPGGVGSTLSPTSLNADGTVTLNLTGLNSLASNTYTITLTATSPSITKQTTVDLIIADGVCPSEGDLSFQTRTTGVIFNTINNLDAGPKTAPYSDFTSISTDVEAGMDYDLSVRANSDGPYRISTRVWIDWNQNCSFNDPGEEYDLDLGTTANVADELTDASPLTITVPVDAIAGTTLMRVSTKYSPPSPDPLDFPTSCETGFDGEVEDYSINVINDLSIDDNELDNLSIYPNPNNGTFSIGFNPRSGEDINVEVYDIRGRAIFTKAFNSTNRFDEVIRLSNAQSGVYLLNIFDGSYKVTKKIVVE